MCNIGTLLRILSGIVLTMTVFVRPACAQFGTWEAVTDVHGGYAAHMLDLGDGRILLSGPSSHAGRNGHGLFVFTPEETALKDVTPSWAEVHALAWADDRSVLCANGDGIWRSPDGVSWTQVYDSTVTALDCLRDGNCYAAQQNGTVLRSTNDGASWEVLSTDIQQFVWIGTARQFSMNQKGWMICTLPLGPNPVSLDGGRTWELSHKISDRARIEISGYPILVTSDSGRVISGNSWPGVNVLAGNWLHTAASHTFLTSPNQTCTRTLVQERTGPVYLGIGTTIHETHPRQLRPDTCGVLVSYDEGSTWKWLRRDIDVMNMICTAEGDLLVSTMLDGFIRIDTADGSSTPLPCSYGYVSDLLFSDGVLLASMDSCHVNGTLNSTDAGMSWSWSDTMRYVVPQFLAPSRLTLMPDSAVRKNHWLISRDNGRSWDEQHFVFQKYYAHEIRSVAGFTDGTLLLSDISTRRDSSFLFRFDQTQQQIDLALRPELGNIRQLYAYADNRLLLASENGLYLSSDRGSSFQPTLPDNIVSLQPLRDGGMIAGFDDEEYSFAWNSWGGTSFAKFTIARGLGVVDANGWQDWLYVLCAKEFDQNGEAVMGSEKFVRGTLDRASWYNLDQGLPTKELTALCIDGQNNLYVGTRGCGLFRMKLPVVGVEPVSDPSLPLTVSIHPQPVNDALQVTVDIAHPIALQVAVYDLLGRRIRQLAVTGLLQAGEHVIPMTIAGLSPGAYLLSVTAEDHSARKVLPLLIGK